MSDNIFLLPDEVNGFDGACTFSEWVLAWNDCDVFSWSLRDGWRQVSSSASAIDSAWACNEGVMVVCKKELFFWIPGEDRWCWQCPRPGANHSMTDVYSVNSGFMVFFEYL